MPVISTQIKPPLSIIALSRPEANNALRAEDFRALASALRQSSRRADICATVVQASGKVFSHGGDILEIAENTATHMSTVSANRRYFEFQADVVKALMDHEKVLVVELQGPVFGMVAGLITMFDVIYAMPAAFMVQPMRRIHSPLEGFSSWTLPRRFSTRLESQLLRGEKVFAHALQAGCADVKVLAVEKVSTFHTLARSLVCDMVLDPAVVGSLMARRISWRSDPSWMPCLEEELDLIARSAMTDSTRKFAFALMRPAERHWLMCRL